MIKINNNKKGLIVKIKPFLNLNKIEMKQYINSYMNYTGSKYKLIQNGLLDEMDYNKNHFIDLFTGGGSVFINVVDKYDTLICNDIIKDVISIHKEIIYNGEDFVNKVKELSPNDKESFLKLRDNYNQIHTADALFALMLSSTNNMMRFNLKMNYNQSYGERCFNPSTEKKINEFIEHITPYKDKLIFKSESFENIIPTNPSMIYADPPYGYCINNGEITSKSISEAGYNSIWKKEHDIKLYNYLNKLDKDGHSFVMSNVWEHDGNTSWICEKLIGDGFKCKELAFDYSKVSRNKIDKGTVEVIIKNF